MKQIIQYFLEGESPTLKQNELTKKINELATFLINFYTSLCCSEVQWYKQNRSFDI